MEVSFDLAQDEANSSIVIRSRAFVTKEMIYFKMMLLNYIPMKYVDALVTLSARFKYADLCPYEIRQPSIGPFSNKIITERTHVTDVGTIIKIRSEEIKVVCIKDDTIKFFDSTTKHFDVMVSTTGYKSVANIWLKVQLFWKGYSCNLTFSFKFSPSPINKASMQCNVHCKRKSKKKKKLTTSVSTTFINSSKKEMETTVIIVGAGPAGLATSACLNYLSIPNIIMVKETCSASLWRLYSYDCVHLHLAKQFCQLPYAPHDSMTPTFMPKSKFIEYIDNYTLKNKINPLYSCFVEATSFDSCSGRWKVEATNKASGETEVYYSKFIVIASGENNVGFIPRVTGLESFTGRIIHSNQYRNGSEFQGKQVLVVGCGNSGMEISFDLSKHGANSSIVIRSTMIYFGMVLLKYIPMKYVDALVTLWVRFEYEDLSPYGIRRPSIVPFSNKVITRRTHVIDVGTVGKIRAKEIKVVPEIVCVKEDIVEFSDGTTQHFDVMVFLTGYKSVANTWLKDDHYILNDKSMPKNPSPMHWKGENRSYCVGFSGNGLNGISRDAIAVATKISCVLHGEDFVFFLFFFFERKKTYITE
ncbi:Flavin-binding monooxygenase family protein [Euphorbia peplus]|nr:Flavin-binding monooxygenase family protein [Euphorbia peplus]